MAVDQQDVPMSASKPAVGGRGGAEKESFESLLPDVPEQGFAIDHIAAQEVKVVSSRKTAHPGLLSGLLLFCILVFGLGYYYLFIHQSAGQSTDQITSYSSPKIPLPARTEIASTVIDAAPTLEVEKAAPVVVPAIKKENLLYSVTVGPLINASELEQATKQLRDLGLQPEEKKGRGQVAMVRLLRGGYSAEKGREQLAKLKKVSSSAFLIPDGDQMKVYAGSFHQHDRARQMQDELALQKIEVSLVESLIAMDGTMLIVMQADEKTALELAADITSFGFQAQVKKKN